MIFDVVFAVTPSIGWLAIVFAVYALVIIPLVFWGLGRTGKRGLAWVILPIIAIVTAAGLWLYVHQQVVA